MGARRPEARFPGISLLYSPLRPGIAASRGPASEGRVSRSCCSLRGHSPSPSAAWLSDQLDIDSFLSIGVRPVTLACFPVGSSRVVADRFLSTRVRPCLLALFRAGPSRLTSAVHLDLFPARFSWLVPAPVHPQTSCGISPPAGREYRNARAGVCQDYGDPRARNRCSGRETTSKSMQRPAQHVVSCGRTS